MNPFNKPFQNITFQDVADFCALQRPESTTLDYKQAMPKDLAKHFATFSNTLGGVILIGVEEDSKTGLPLKWDGVTNDAKLIERVNQFAGNVTPLPSFNVRTTDQVSGKVFVLINILEGDVPPYNTNNDPTIWLRTGNTSTPLRQAERDELVRMVDKKAAAEKAREANIATAAATFAAGLAQAETERIRMQAEDDELQRSNRTEPWNVNNSFFTVSLQPYYPERLLVEPWEVQAKLQDLRTYNQYGMDMPPLDMEPSPGGLFAIKASWTGDNLHAYQLYGNGLVSYTEDVWNRDNRGEGKNIYLSHVGYALYRQMLFASKFYGAFNYSGVVSGEITLNNALGASVHIIVAQNRYTLSRTLAVIEKLSDYRWPLEMDTNMLHDAELRANYFKKIMRKIYWDLGIASISDSTLDVFLEEAKWK
jgi:hypothetical protein